MSLEFYLSFEKIARNWRDVSRVRKKTSLEAANNHRLPCLPKFSVIV